MKIVLAPEVAINLEGLVSHLGRQEFSGVGFIENSNGDLYVYDILLLNVGSTGYSEIPADKLVQATQGREDKDKLRLWFHRHPVEGWSATDLNTILTAPLGGIPELVRWSASIVRTPTRWIGRVDNHLTKTHVVAEVVPNINPSLIALAQEMLGEYWDMVKAESEEIEPLSDHTQLIRQPLLFGIVELADLDDWLDVIYPDDEEEGWGEVDLDPIQEYLDEPIEELSEA